MSKSIARAAVVIMIMNMAVRLLGFVRETAIAGRFGATYLTDAYLVAYTLPYFLQTVLGMALVSSIVPVVTKYLVKNEEEEAWRIASITLNWTAFFMAGFAVLGMVGSRILVAITAPGFDETAANLAGVLTVIMFPSVIFVGAGMLITGILNAKKSFALAAFAPGFTSLIIILAAVFWGQYGIHYLAWGTLLGMAGAMLIQFPALRRIKFRYVWDWNFRHPEVRGIFANLLPIFLGTAVNQIYLAINRFFASGLAEGSISALNYAGKLMNLPMGVFVLAVSSAIFPTLAEQAVQGDKQALGQTLSRGLKLVLLVTLPAAAGLMALAGPIVRLLFERGAFDAVASAMTAEALFYFCIGMSAMAANMVITRAYYAVGDVKTPLYLGFISIIVNIVASILLMPSLGHSGLALANTLAALSNAGLMFFLLRRHLPRLYVLDLLASSGKALFASLITALAASCTYRGLMANILNMQTSAGLLAGVFAAVIIGVAAFGVSIILLREKETLLLLEGLKARLRRRGRT